MSLTLKELYAETRQLPREQAAELMDLLLIDTFGAPDPAVEEAWGREIDRRLAELESGRVESVPGEQVMAEVRKIVGLCDSLRRITALSRVHYDMNETLYRISQKDVFDTLETVRQVRRGAVRYDEPLAFCDSCQKMFESKGDDVVRFRGCSHTFHHACLLSGVISDVAIDHQNTVTAVQLLEDPWRYASGSMRGRAFPACLLCD
jgi:putative addiction module component (TIGR02574 family)